MKNFFKKLFGKKYPDRANGPSTRHGRVYAGPGYFRNRAEGVYAGPRMRDDESMLCVYAGPPEDLDPEVEDVVLEEVYNGPGMMDEIGWGGEPDPIEEPDVEPDAEPVSEPDAEPETEPVAETDDTTAEMIPGRSRKILRPEQNRRRRMTLPHRSPSMRKMIPQQKRMRILRRIPAGLTRRW